MKKIFLFALLFAATAMMAEVRVEDFNIKSGGATNTYVTTVTSRECSQATWTFFSGGILKNLGDMGSTNYAAIIRAKKSTETEYPYIYSDSIEDGIDSLWLTWNSNGNETGGKWNVIIYINNDSIGAITGDGGPKAASPFHSYNVGNLNKEGKFVLKFVNKSPYDGTGNSMRFVFDDLSWTTHGSAPVKQKPTFEFADETVYKLNDAEAFTNTLTNTSDGTPVFESSVPAVATVDQEGLVTIVGEGTTVITASVAETETFKAAEASYTLRVVPQNFHIETFEGASNITSGTSYYITKDSVCPASKATGIVWTTYLGSIRNTMASWPAANEAACIRAKKSAEPKFGYLKSSTISGGIDSLAFDWNCNGDESARVQDWNIVIYINGDSVGGIYDETTAKQAAGSEFRYTLGNLKIDGDFVIEIVNKDTAEADANQFRWVMDNLEWYSYEAPCEGQYGILVDGTDYIAGVKNEGQTEWLEYTITADLKKDQTFVFEDHCTGGTFMAGQDNGEGNYKFNYTEGENPAFLVPQDGHFTIYLKMYGPDNNWIWTVYADPTTGIENTAMKADVRKAIENGQIVIYRNGVRYSLQGQAF